MESKKPIDSAFNQQRLEDWQPKLNINGLISIYFVVAAVFLPVGLYLRAESNAVTQYKIQYDGTNAEVSDCTISESNAGSTCTVTFTFTKDVSGPLFLYYQIDHFYQNHRRYVKSRSSTQLLGSNLGYDDVASDCYPMIMNGTSLLNPCGLIANTFFNDVIELDASATADGYVLDTDGIAWSYDTDVKYKQVDGFVSGVASSSSLSCASVLGHGYSDCKQYTDPDDGTLYYYWYPDDDTVQYLHESFDIVSPIKGVTDEHFVNWMRTAGLPSFRKLYGKIDSDFVSGDTIAFDLTLNFEVESYGGTKTLVLTNLGSMGAKSTALGNSYLIFGSISLVIGAILALKRIIKPRPLGDIRELAWNSY